MRKFFRGDDSAFEGGQVSSEIKAFRDYYKTLVPSCMIIYDRTAFFEPDGDLRLTIDENPRYRNKRSDADKSMDGIPLLDEA